MSPKVHSLERAIEYGLENGKRNVIADLAPLQELLASHRRLLTACEQALQCLTSGDRTMWEHPESPYHWLHAAITQAKGDRP